MVILKLQNWVNLIDYYWKQSMIVAKRDWDMEITIKIKSKSTFDISFLIRTPLLKNGSQHFRLATILLTYNWKYSLTQVW